MHSCRGAPGTLLHSSGAILPTVCPRVQQNAPSRPGLAKGQCARESARPGILGQGRGKTCRIGVGTCGGIGSPSSFSRLKTAWRSSRLPFLLLKEGILTSILPFHTPIVIVSRAFSSFPYLQETLSDAYRYSDASLGRPQNTYIIINYLKRHRSATSTASRSRVQRNAPQRNASLEPHFDLPHAFRSLGPGPKRGALIALSGRLVP